MKASPTLMATLVGTVVGTGGWIFGLGKVLWPGHPMWALFFATLASAIVTQIVMVQDARRTAARLPQPPR